MNNNKKTNKEKTLKEINNFFYENEEEFFKEVSDKNVTDFENLLVKCLSIIPKEEKEDLKNRKNFRSLFCSRSCKECNKLFSNYEERIIPKDDSFCPSFFVSCKNTSNFYVIKKMLLILNSNEVHLKEKEYLRIMLLLREPFKYKEDTVLATIFKISEYLSRAFPKSFDKYPEGSFYDFFNKDFTFKKILYELFDIE